MMMTMFIIYRRLEGRHLSPRSRFSIINRSNYRELLRVVAFHFLRLNLRNSFEFHFLKEFQNSNTLISDPKSDVCEHCWTFTFDKFPWIAPIVWQMITKEHAEHDGFSSSRWMLIYFCLGATATIHSFIFVLLLTNFVDSRILLFSFFFSSQKKANGFSFEQFSGFIVRGWFITPF